MGCDIHAFVEVKRKGKDNWEPFGHAPISRRYGVFGLMAGVRGNEDMFPAKGLPDDVTEIVKIISDDWDLDGHTHSYLTKDEIKLLWQKLEDWCKDDKDWTEKYKLEREFGEINGHTIVRFSKGNVEDGLGTLNWLEDVRLVFWFDN